MSPGDEPLEEATSAEVKPKSQRRKKVKLEKVPASEPPKVAEIPEIPPRRRRLRIRSAIRAMAMALPFRRS